MSPQTGSFIGGIIICLLLFTPYYDLANSVGDLASGGVTGFKALPWSDFAILGCGAGLVLGGISVFFMRLSALAALLISLYNVILPPTTVTGVEGNILPAAFDTSWGLWLTVLVSLGLTLMAFLSNQQDLPVVPED